MAVLIVKRLLYHEYLDHQPNLQFLTRDIDNIVMLSIYCLPDDVQDRQKIYEIFDGTGCELLIDKPHKE